MSPYPVLLFLLFCFTSIISSASCVNKNEQIPINKPEAVYLDHGDGTLTDRYTQLMWQVCTLGLNYSANGTCVGTSTASSWQGALAGANANADYGHSDWRLPNKKELDSLVEVACYRPAIHQSLFVSTELGWYWSSTPYVDQSDRAWSVDFSWGAVEARLKNELGYVRLVRGN